MDLDLIPAGLTAGSLYALVAMGFNILYRPTNVFNFAQGDLVMLGAMVGASVMALAGLPWLAGAAAAMLCVAVLALVEERVAVAPVLKRSAHGHSWVITTLAISMIIGNLVGRIWGPDPIAVKPPAPLSTETFYLLGMAVSSYQLALIAVTLLLVFGVEGFYRTRSGKAVMAVAEDRDAALLRGIDPDRLSRWSFFLGGAVAALTGILAAPLLYASTGLGPSLLLKGFAAAAVGGIGNNRGALLAGYIIGMAEAVGAAVLSPGYQLAMVFAVMLVILLIRPHGLFGSAEARTV
ncbi:branched-chain amino acid ABC transporter permease [Vineibacter terrae]|uniref:Branched-chain amino acid ABC transporter permease n=1 Tax=Vineibacter terrae TaxID=2586908 RepID=A0A5C8PQT9_9HYPH|nr:branched-chain amino acid ABC transporter permease [Vineibacter terrae]TXL77567.1 branched-chain amino acid ABC transporter permease [Vineibacter terrae]